jgi:hypothetical protein
MVKKNRRFTGGAAPSGGWKESYVDSKTSVYLDERDTDSFMHRMGKNTLPYM